MLLFLVPFYAVIAVAFGNVDALLQTPVPIWNPLDWNVGWMEQVLSDLAPGGVYWGAVVRTIEYVALSLFFSVLIGYPVAYYIARHARRTQEHPADPSDHAVLDQLPDADAGVGQPAGRRRVCHPLSRLHPRLSNLAVHLGLLSQQDAWLNGQSFTVIAALVYGYIPYFILPLYASLDRIDKSLLEAGRDLGGSPFSTFLHVTLPLSKTGLLGGAVLIALPMFGDYYTPNIVSGRTDHLDDR